MDVMGHFLVLSPNTSPADEAPRSCSSPRTPPSARWGSFTNWNYNGMKERLRGLHAQIHKAALVRHAETVTGQ
ncbi:hypothetical protein B0T26DRAFT_752903 [Lasiosphaeria miniovina]|uniref:Uncharacterized protein n=1 Tax=Lasiosphaeria miniovina TaxID=1954250 RepID=A0AA40ABA1_9PEZI|nr:uncharacterized protein B0T26DRAFT_752903 [Lasiosphaeria miniovina]KAK0712703.1 hypothetical protein B0T26DRAFT_752903 [Lasiosphaeria miniovina]